MASHKFSFPCIWLNFCLSFYLAELQLLLNFHFSLLFSSPLFQSSHCISQKDWILNFAELSEARWFCFGSEITFIKLPFLAGKTILKFKIQATTELYIGMRWDISNFVAKNDKILNLADFFTTFWYIIALIINLIWKSRTHTGCGDFFLNEFLWSFNKVCSSPIDKILKSGQEGMQTSFCMKLFLTIKTFCGTNEIRHFSNILL